MSWVGMEDEEKYDFVPTFQPLEVSDQGVITHMLKKGSHASVATLNV